MRPELKIHRHGYHLMSLASAGSVCTLLLGVLLASMPWLPDWHPQSTIWKIGEMDWERTQALSNNGKWLATSSCLLWTLACLAPLLALRRLGDRLYRYDALSRPVADGFHWLAHSLPLHALLKLGAWTLEIAAEGDGGGEIGLTWDIGGTYLFLVGCLCLYSVAHVMRLASAAAEDARSIV